MLIARSENFTLLSLHRPEATYLVDANCFCKLRVSVLAVPKEANCII